MHEVHHKANCPAEAKDLESRADSQSSFGGQTSRLSISVKPGRKFPAGAASTVLCGGQVVIFPAFGLVRIRYGMSSHL